MIRSYLFVPAHRADLLSKAHARHADALLLDLEDSVPTDQKQVAREALPETVSGLSERGIPVVVRVNSDLGECVRDLEAAVTPGVDAVMLSKVFSKDYIRLVDDFLSSLELRAGIAQGCVRLIALIETAEGMINASNIALSSSRLEALAFGTEDYATDCGHSPSKEALIAPAQTLVQAAKAAGVRAIGLPGSIADVEDLKTFGENVALARGIGFDAVMCIHPAQVLVVNATCAPSKAELDYAARVVGAFDDALEAGRGAVLLDGRMIDPPIVKRAQAMLRSLRA